MRWCGASALLPRQMPRAARPCRRGSCAAVGRRGTRAPAHALAAQHDAVRRKARCAILHRARGMVRAARCVGGAARCDPQAAAARALTRHSTAAPVGVRETASAHGHDALHASAHVRFSGIDQSSNLRPRSACGGGRGGRGCVAAAEAQCPPSAAVNPRRHRHAPHRVYSLQP